MIQSQLNEVFFQVKKHFREQEDKSEHWQMPPPDYYGDQRLRDDCDGFCLACRVLLRKLCIANRLVYCVVEGEGHLVIEVDGWILDIRQRAVVANTFLKSYRWKRISGYQPRDPWKEIV